MVRTKKKIKDIFILSLRYNTTYDPKILQNIIDWVSNTDCRYYLNACTLLQSYSNNLVDEIECDFFFQLELCTLLTAIIWRHTFSELSLTINVIMCSERRLAFFFFFIVREKGRRSFSRKKGVIETVSRSAHTWFWYAKRNTCAQCSQQIIASMDR